MPDVVILSSFVWPFVNVELSDSFNDGFFAVFVYDDISFAPVHITARDKSATVNFFISSFIVFTTPFLFAFFTVHYFL